MLNIKLKKIPLLFLGIISSIFISSLIFAVVSWSNASLAIPFFIFSASLVILSIHICKKQRVLIKYYFKTLGITTIVLAAFFCMGTLTNWWVILILGIVFVFVGIVIKKEKPHDIEDVQLETKIPEQNGGIKVVIKEVPVESNQTANNAENKKVYKESVCKYCGADFNDDDSRCAYCGRIRH